MGRHTRFAHLSDADFKAVAQTNVEALNHALQGIPVEQIRIHVCWGNYAGPHHYDIELPEIWPLIRQITCKYILLEAANGRHCFEWASLSSTCLRADQVCASAREVFFFP